jgi:hypothetical protein
VGVGLVDNRSSTSGGFFIIIYRTG